jgi:chromosome segregation ATPase
LKQKGQETRRQIELASAELEAFDSQAGQQISKLRRISSETARAWEWIQQNLDKFEKPVFGPPILECSVKDLRYADMVESLFQSNDFLSITTQTKADFRKLSSYLYDGMKMSDINIKTSTGSLDSWRSPVHKEQLQDYGLDGYAIDFLSGPEPVLAMLCDSVRLNEAGVGLRDVSEEQYNKLLNSRIGTWATGGHNYRVQRRAQYGAGATSTTTRNTRRAQVWVHQPIDTAAKSTVQERISTLTSEFETLKAESISIRESKAALKEEMDSVKKEAVGLCFPVIL